MSNQRLVAIIDGEHYPPVVEAALSQLRDEGANVVAAVMAGGSEKLPASGTPEAIGRIPVITGADPRGSLEEAISTFEPDVVYDLSDEPVLDYRRRHQLASIALYRDVAYQGPDFSFSPPPRPRLCRRPSVAVVSTGKRTGKTAVAGFLARGLVAAGRRPIVVAMGRGGPEEPEVLRGDEIELSVRDLVALADAGKHAASDYIEDAALARVPTVGCRRCGGGLAGAVGPSNVGRGIEIANELPGDIIVLEGSGAAIPPAHADTSVLAVPSSIPEEYIEGYMGLYRLLLADFAIVTMCENPFGSPSRISSIASRLHSSYRSVRRGGANGGQGSIEVVRSVFRPNPTRKVEGAAAVVATTAPQEASESMRMHLEEVHGCRVVGISHALADRKRLAAELQQFGGNVDVLLCEIKAAGIDVAARWAVDAGIDVVFIDNALVGVNGDDPSALVGAIADLADARFEGHD